MDRHAENRRKKKKGDRGLVRLRPRHCFLQGNSQRGEMNYAEIKNLQIAWTERKRQSQRERERDSALVVCVVTLCLLQKTLLFRTKSKDSAKKPLFFMLSVITQWVFRAINESDAPDTSNTLKMEGDEEWERLNKCTSTIFQSVVQIQAHYGGKCV